MKKQQYNIANDKFDKFDLSNLLHVYENDQKGLYFNLARTINFTKPENIPPYQYQLYTVNEHDTWPLISYKFYGTYKLWWLICKINLIFNPVNNEPESGKIIKVLKKEVVEQVLTSIKIN